MKKIGKIFRESMVTQIKDGVTKRTSTFVVSYDKVSASQMNSLRKGLRSVGAHIYVSRKSLAQIALNDMKFNKLAERVAGQTAFVWSDADSAEISKTLVKFTKECQGVVIQGALLSGAVLEQNDVVRLSDLPSKNVLRAQLLGTLNAPMTRLLGALNGKSRDLLSILKQLSEKKGGK